MTPMPMLSRREEPVRHLSNEPDEL
jgi:hypothetical protein